MPARGRDQCTGCCTELQCDVDGQCLLSELGQAVVNAPRETPVCDMGVPCPSFHPAMALWCTASHFQCSPCWQGTCLSTLGSFL